jgi:hypothetical protein
VPLSHARLVAAGARPGSWGRRLGRAAVEVPLLVLALVGALTLVRSYQATGTVLPALGGPAAEAVVDGLRGALLPAGAGPGGPAAPGPGEPE